MSRCSMSHSLLVFLCPSEDHASSSLPPSRKASRKNRQCCVASGWLVRQHTFMLSLSFWVFRLYLPYTSRYPTWKWGHSCFLVPFLLRRTMWGSNSYMWKTYLHTYSDNPRFHIYYTYEVYIRRYVVTATYVHRAGFVGQRHLRMISLTQMGRTG